MIVAGEGSESPGTAAGGMFHRHMVCTSVNLIHAGI